MHKGTTYEGFASDKKTVDAVIRNFELIGEATKEYSVGSKA
ncbi:MAG: HepT-like ribonuclease domain-containing protein [Candidatus Bathyarchaeia archaeon]